MIWQPCLSVLYCLCNQRKAKQQLRNQNDRTSSTHGSHFLFSPSLRCSANIPLYLIWPWQTAGRLKGTENSVMTEKSGHSMKSQKKTLQPPTLTTKGILGRVEKQHRLGGTFLFSDLPWVFFFPSFFLIIKKKKRTVKQKKRQGPSQEKVDDNGQYAALST